uniref:DUF4806 domain-containing protein n=1 Tax=Strongyloides venezuelensis TaxID=75913 RepID=A0A0K0FSV8_STRVS
MFVLIQNNSEKEQNEEIINICCHILPKNVNKDLKKDSISYEEYVYLDSFEENSIIERTDALETCPYYMLSKRDSADKLAPNFDETFRRRFMLDVRRVNVAIHKIVQQSPHFTSIIGSMHPFTKASKIELANSLYQIRWTFKGATYESAVNSVYALMKKSRYPTTKKQLYSCLQSINYFRMTSPLFTKHSKRLHSFANSKLLKNSVEMSPELVGDYDNLLKCVFAFPLHFMPTYEPYTLEIKLMHVKLVLVSVSFMLPNFVMYQSFFPIVVSNFL